MAGSSLGMMSSSPQGMAIDAEQPRVPKRRLADEHHRSAKRTRSEAEYDAWLNWVFPPEFYDRASRVFLTRRAVQELNRHSALLKQRRRFQPRPVDADRSVVSSCQRPERDLRLFSRHGGPDLSDLRGYPPPPVMPRSSSSAALSSGSSSRKLPVLADPALPSESTSKTTKSKKSSPYDHNFALHLSEHGVLDMLASDKADLADIEMAIDADRDTEITGDVFASFVDSSLRARDEDDVIAHVIPFLLGPDDLKLHPSGRNTLFGNIAALTDGTIVSAKPDIYYGASPFSLAAPVRNALSRTIVPSTMLEKPLAPNFFFEIKGPGGSAEIAERQARYSGAIGARAMHSLRAFAVVPEGALSPDTFDGRVRTLSVTFCAGMLQLFAHHVTAPTAASSQPTYHMTLVDAWAMQGNIRSFRRGVIAFRNARDLAKHYRDELIETANRRARSALQTDASTGGRVVDASTNGNGTATENTPALPDALGDKPGDMPGMAVAKRKTDTAGEPVKKARISAAVSPRAAK